MLAQGTVFFVTALFLHGVLSGYVFLYIDNVATIARSPGLSNGMEFPIEERLLLRFVKCPLSCVRRGSC
ncbi:hypothetical protein P4V00_26135, partial [Brevibacillus agri]|uniref:hypothetical protein n=1 Tax=Brevibacillus agri TaxID=51101 RepID=UPI002E23BAF0|nr:hypothetical protein [Brevibacillus agri]